MTSYEELDLASLVAPFTCGDEEIGLICDIVSEDLRKIHETSKLISVWETLEKQSEEALSHLAWQRHVEGYYIAKNREARIQMIRDSIQIHIKKGTVESIRAALKASGYGDATFTEDLGADDYNGSITYSGSHYYGDEQEGGTHWAKWLITLDRPVSISQAQKLYDLLDKTAPVRSHLWSIYFAKASLLYNGDYKHDEQYTHGVVAWRI